MIMNQQSQGFLNHVLGGITSFAQHHFAERREHQERLAFLHNAIEQVVDASEPRIRLIGNYQDKLADPVETALHHCGRVLQQLPAAVALDGQAWTNNPQVNAFFATAGDVRTILDQNAPIQEFFAGNPAPECFALLLMVKQEAESFGTALDGDMLVREVRQIQVWLKGLGFCGCWFDRVRMIFHVFISRKGVAGSVLKLSWRGMLFTVQLNSSAWHLPVITALVDRAPMQPGCP